MRTVALTLSTMFRYMVYCVLSTATLSQLILSVCCMLRLSLLCTNSFTILENSDVDMLFGLDMLKRHQCVLDLKQGVLRMGSGNVTVPFLSEGVSSTTTAKHL
jgi:Aspartyl protease